MVPGARSRARTSPYRDFYVWRSDKPPDTTGQGRLPRQGDGHLDQRRATGEWYLHTLLQAAARPELANPQVRDEIAKVIGFWVELGLSGFRVDAVPFFLATTAGTPGDDGLQDPHDFLEALRAFLDAGGWATRS